MTKFLLLLSVTLGFALARPIEVRQGSLVVAILSQTGDYVAVAAESRNLDSNLQVQDDRACKIIALGDETMFFETGSSVIGVHHGTNWDARKVARAAYRESKNRDSESLSIAWGNQALKWFYGHSPQDLSLVTDHGQIVTAGFINFLKNGALPARSQTLFYSETEHILSRHEPRAPAGLGQAVISGVAKELVIEFLDAKTIRAVNAFGAVGAVGATRRIGEDPNIDSSVARKAIQYAIDNSPGTDHAALGGPIDIGIVRRGRPIEWVSRKPECYREDLKTASVTTPK